MGKYSNIEWTTHTWNPWRGCHKVSTGCKNCYMFREQERYGKDPNVVVGAAMSTFTAPRRWKEPAYVFTCSYSDFFIEEADEWRILAWQIIKETPHLTYQILTKRPQNIPDRLPDDWGEGYENVWLGVTVEDDTNSWRVDALHMVSAELYFVSCEPLVGELDVRPWFFDWVKVDEPVVTRDMALDAECPEMEGQVWDEQWEAIPKDPLVDWLIIGGESGPEARPLDLANVDSILQCCAYTDCPAFVKQLGQHWAREHGAKSTKGQDPNEWPEHLRIREMPK